MSQVVQDLKYAFRMFAKRPVFTAAGVLTLALGIGLNAAVFSAVHALLLRPLPGVHEPERLVQFYREWPGIPYGSNSIPHFQDMRDRTGDVFEGAAASTFVQVSLATEDRSEMLMGAMVSANFFDVLGVRAMRGRTFTADEATGPGAHPVVVLGHGLWQRRFGGDPSLVGRSITVNGQPFTVVGIAPEEFKGAQRGVEPALYVPLMMQEVIRPGQSLMEARGSNFLSGVARLRNGVTAAQAEEAMQGLLAGLREDHPDQYGNSGILLVRQADAGIHPSMRDAQVGMSTVIMAVVALLLLVACVNVANLFLARAGERRKEMGIRLSLGARRGRIVRQLLTESLVFSLLAGGAGVVLAWAAIRVGNSIRPPVDFPVSFDLALDPPVLAFTATVALLTGVVFGLVPALQEARDGLGPQGRVGRGGLPLTDEPGTRGGPDGALDPAARERGAVRAEPPGGHGRGQGLRQRQPAGGRRPPRPPGLHGGGSAALLPRSPRAGADPARCEPGGPGRDAAPGLQQPADQRRRAGLRAVARRADEHRLQRRGAGILRGHGDPGPGPGVHRGGRRRSSRGDRGERALRPAVLARRGPRRSSGWAESGAWWAWCPRASTSAWARRRRPTCTSPSSSPSTTP